MQKQAEALDLALLLAVEGESVDSNVQTYSALLSTLASNPHMLRYLQGHQGDIHSVAFSPDGSILASGSEDGTTRLWNIATGQVDGVLLNENESWVKNVVFSPDGTVLISAGWDSVIRLWDVATGQELLILTGHRFNTAGVAFSPDGTRLAVSGGDGTARIYVLPIEDLMTLARMRVTRALTDEECRQYLHLDQCP